MSRFMSQTLSQQMRMEQRLTPQLIQSMAVLQKPVADLEAYVAQALETNAALEIDESHPEPEASQEAPPRSEHEQEVEAGFRRLNQFAREYDPDWAAERRVARGSFDDADPKM